jgi:PGF-pre-PGF domain-containing protein
VVGLSASGQPSGVVVRFSPSSGTPSFTSTFTISVGRNAPTGAYVITIIGAGTDGTVHSTTYTLKIKIPLSSVNSIVPYWQKATPFSITAMTSDNGGQVTNVALYYHYSSDNLSWGSWTLFGVDNEEPWSWSFTAPRGDGYYEFYSIARDNKGYEESAKPRAEARCGVDTTAPMAPVLISPVDGMRTRDTTPAFDWGDVTDLSGVTYEFTITAYDTNVMTKTVPSSSYAIESSEALPESIYHWRVRTVDGAGNVSDWSKARSFTIELVPPITVNLGTIHANVPKVADLARYNVFIIKVTIITSRDVDNVEISIKEFIGKPAWVSEPSGIMYSIYATVTTNIAPSDMSSAIVLFQLPKLWITQNGIDDGTVKLLRTGSNWHTLSTTPVGGNENYSYFDATTSGFSLFVATGEKAIPPAVPPSRLPLLLIILSIIAVVVGGAIAYYLLMPSRQFAVLRRLERAVVRPRKRQIGELVRPPARVHKRVSRADQMALRRLERIMRERERRIGELEVKPPVRVSRRVSRTDKVALRRLEHIMRERKKKWERERQKKSVKRKVKPRKMRKKSVNRRVKLKKVKQKKLVKGRKRSKTKS